jgi:hypothetical protein
MVLSSSVTKNDTQPDEMLMAVDLSLSAMAMCSPGSETPIIRGVAHGREKQRPSAMLSANDAHGNGAMRDPQKKQS